MLILYPFLSALVGLLFSFTVFAQLNVDNWCTQAQQVLIDDESVPIGIQNKHFLSFWDFIESKSTLSVDGIETKSYLPDFHQRGTHYSSLWCKMKSQKAVSQTFNLQNSLSPQTCDSVQKYWVSALLARKPYLAEVANQVDYTTYNHTMGGTWAPSKLRMKIGEKTDQIIIESQSLMTNPWVPVLGGMHYCKMLSPEGLEALLEDLYNKTYDRIPYPLLKEKDINELAGQDLFGAQIKWTAHDFGTTHDTKVFADLKRSDYQGALIISPGGQLHAMNYRGLAKAFARQGWVVFVVDYPYNLAIFDKRNTAVELANQLRIVSDVIGLLPVSLRHYLIKAQEEQHLKIVGLGHSLGGAVWGKYLNQEKSPFDTIFFYGVNGLIDFDATDIQADHVHFLFGLEDSVVFSDYEGKSFEKFIASLGVVKKNQSYWHPSKNMSVQLIKNMTHFSIISDKEAGLLPVRLIDGQARDPKEGILRLLQTVNAVIGE